MAFLLAAGICIGLGIRGSLPVAAAAGGTVSTSAASGSLSGPYSMTGSIDLAGVPTGSRVVIALEALPADAGCVDSAYDGPCGGRYLPGTYRLSFANCSGGSITAGTETISGRTGNIASSASSLLVLPSGGADVVCDYAIGFAGSAPAGTMSSVRNHVFVFTRGAQVAELLGPPSMAPVQAPAPIIPEAPFAVLLPLSAAATCIAIFALVMRRRRVQA